MANRFTNSGCFKCDSCGKRTRDTGDNGDLGLCPLCYERSAWDNALSDRGIHAALGLTFGALHHCNTVAEVRAQFNEYARKAEQTVDTDEAKVG